MFWSFFDNDDDDDDDDDDDEIFLWYDWPTKSVSTLFPEGTIVRDPRHRESPMCQAGFEPAQNLSSDFVEWRRYSAPLNYVENFYAHLVSWRLLPKFWTKLCDAKPNIIFFLSWMSIPVPKKIIHLNWFCLLWNISISHTNYILHPFPHLVPKASSNNFGYIWARLLTHS